jgi:hypothetical protein
MLEMCDQKFNYIIIDINIQQCTKKCTFLTLQAKVHVQGSQNCIDGVKVNILASGAVDCWFKL